MSAQTQRTLRIITLIAFLPGFGLLIPAGVEGKKAVNSYYYYHSSHVPPFFFGFIPLSLSAFTALGYIYSKPAAGEKSEKRRACAMLVADMLLVGAYLGVLLPVWIEEPRWLEMNARVMLLEGYATVPLLLNMCIHAFLVLSNKIVVKFVGSLGQGKECPHCHHRIGGGVDMAGKGKGEGYSLLRGEDYLDAREYDEDAQGPSQPRSSEERNVVEV